MSVRIGGLAASAVVLIATVVWSQEQGGSAQPTQQQKIEALKQSVAANRAALQKYQWIEATELKIKGETKKQEQEQCYYGADGKVQKTLIGSPSPPSATPPPKGIKGKIVANKVADLKEDMTALKKLVGMYVPPNPQQMQKASQAGKASTPPATGGMASLVFSDYAKPGDQVTFAFDAAKKLRSYTVNTYEEDPKDVVTLAVNFASLQDGTNYVQQTILESKSNEIEVKITNSGYKLAAP